LKSRQNFALLGIFANKTSFHKRNSTFSFNMKQIVNTENAPAPIGPYNQCTIFNGLVFVSGQIAADPKTGQLVLDSIEAETHLTLQNVKAVLEAAGSSLEKVLKASVFVKDINQFSRINAVYAEYFKPEFAPARELVQVAELPKFVNVEISVIATTNA
jgi:2-iminobutanoate/2-iminopropanoate deaminase